MTGELRKLLSKSPPQRGTCAVLGVVIQGPVEGCAGVEEAADLTVRAAHAQGLPDPLRGSLFRGRGSAARRRQCLDNGRCFSIAFN